MGGISRLAATGARIWASGPARLTSFAVITLRWPRGIARMVAAFSSRRLLRHRRAGYVDGKLLAALTANDHLDRAGREIDRCAAKWAGQLLHGDLSPWLSLVGYAVLGVQARLC